MAFVKHFSTTKAGEECLAIVDLTVKFMDCPINVALTLWIVDEPTTLVHLSSVMIAKDLLSAMNVTELPSCFIIE